MPVRSPQAQQSSGVSKVNRVADTHPSQGTVERFGYEPTVTDSSWRSDQLESSELFTNDTPPPKQSKFEGIKIALIICLLLLLFCLGAFGFLKIFQFI